MSKNKLLLTAVTGPYGIKDEYAEGLGMQMELLNNQITREQGAHSPRQSYWSFGLYLLAANIKVPTTILDFPTWQDFTEELKKGYTHVGITFIVPNVLKARRMALYIREHHPETRIILGGYGTVIPDLQDMVPHDALCKGEGVRWLRAYFGEDTEKPISHPAIYGPAFESIYGYKGKPKGAILMTGLGCENGCKFCITSHQFNKCYVPLLQTGRDVFLACRSSESKLRSTGFTIMDENFLKHPERARELLEEMTRHKKPYVFDIFSSAEVIKKLGVDFLVRLGIHMVWIGVESKANTFDKTKGINLKNLIHDLQSGGIIVNASTILFQDHHDEKTLHEDVDWVISLGSDLVQFMNYTPYPTTTLYKELETAGRLNGVDYRHQHGQGRLAFKHPNIDRPEDHIRLLKKAFQKKYEADGPGVLNLAITAIQGYEKAKKDFIEREKQGLAWNPETLRYERTDTPQPDEFMQLRIRKMQKIAMNIRPVLLAAWVLAPNRASRGKAREAMALFNNVLGKPSFRSRIESLVLAGSGIIETAKIKVFKLMGKEVIYQPPVRRTEQIEVIAEEQPVTENTLLESDMDTLQRACG